MNNDAWLKLGSSLSKAKQKNAVEKQQEGEELAREDGRSLVLVKRKKNRKEKKDRKEKKKKDKKKDDMDEMRQIEKFEKKQKKVKKREVIISPIPLFVLTSSASTQIARKNKGNQLWKEI